MSQNNLLDFLTDIITTQLTRQAQSHPPASPVPPTAIRRTGLPTVRGGRLPGPNLHSFDSKLAPYQPPAPMLPTQARNIALNLLEQALKSNLPFDLSQISEVQLNDGNTADVVARLTLHLPFVFKLEMNGDTVREEAQTMRAIKNNPKLNEDFRNAWATVYAIYDKGPPHAYLMEYFPETDGWQSLEKRLYANPRPPATTANDWVNKVIDLMFQGYYSSVQPRSKPNLAKDYYARIVPRLPETEALGKTLPGGNYFASRPLRINGKRYKPWGEYIALLERHADYLDRLTPSFSTVVHGDPNPGNFMLKIASQNSGQVLIKLIDPKDWEHGDYLFDIAKLTHFLKFVGPAEYAAYGNNPPVEVSQNNDELELNYTLAQAEGMGFTIDGCVEKARQFAHSRGDTTWQARYEFAMAANLLGLPLGRLKNGKLFPALIFLAEGIILLDQFCERIEPGFRLGYSVRYVSADTFEPPWLQQQRLWVQQQIPDAIASQNPRGYPHLQWPAPARVGADPSYELSFEHQTRLCCNGDVQINALRSALSASAGGKQTFLSDPVYQNLVVKRAEPGKPAIARYYDDGDERHILINQQICLVECVEPDDKLPAWQLVLPFVALGSTGLRARLAYHWRDSWQQTRTDSLNDADPATRQRNPLALAAARFNINIAKLEAVLQQTTYRETFLIQDASDCPLFAIHLDHVVAQDLASGSFGSYVDIDIACLVEMDEEELPQLSNFVAAVARQYHLVDNQRTSAQRGANAVGMTAPS